jgi:hypothetical protein
MDIWASETLGKKVFSWGLITDLATRVSPAVDFE